MERRIMGKRPRGRPRAGMMDELMECSYVKMKRRAEGREEWRGWVPRTCLRQNTYDDDNTYQYLNYNTVRYMGYTCELIN